ncbi:MAG: hypothetical protein H6581_04905 [Bacteroidia bacterium]|nr:hypothetical protein [Bacteroidia bacterium]
MRTGLLAWVLIFLAGLVQAGSENHLAPFTGLKWEKGGFVCRVDDKWYGLESINDLPVSDYYLRIQNECGRNWYLEFARNLIPEIIEEGFVLGKSVTLGLKSLETGEDVRMEGVPLNHQNWMKAVYFSEVEYCRVQRPHASQTPAHLQFITRRLDNFPCPSPDSLGTGYLDRPVEKLRIQEERLKEPLWKAKGIRWLTPEEARQDLDQLEWYLVHQYAYLDYYKVDYQAALDAIRAGLGEGITLLDFGFQVQRALGLFGDPHTRVTSTLSNEISDRGLRMFTPFAMIPCQDKVLARAMSGKGYYVPDYPYLVAVNGKKIPEWIALAEELDMGEGMPFRRRRALALLEKLSVWLYLVSGENPREIVCEFGNEAGKTVKQKVELVEYWPDEDLSEKFEILQEDVAYLKVIDMREREEYESEFYRFMRNIKTTRGMIIDLRGNPGGKAHFLHDIYPFFVKPGAPPEVMTTGAHRMDAEVDYHPAKGYLFPRDLYPPDYPGLPAEKSEFLQQFDAQFHPEWPLPAGKFSSMCYQVRDIPQNKSWLYYYDKPVIILQDGDCFSATDIFLGVFKGKPGFHLMGQVSRGGSGGPFEAELFHSGLTVKMPRYASYRPNGKLYEKDGIQPDTFYEPTLSDLAGLSDGLLDLALQRLKGKN